MTGKVIVLDGAPGSGKSTIAETLQEKSAAPFLFFDCDSCMEMLPSRLVGFGSEASEGIRLKMESDSSTRVNFGPLGEKLIRGYIHSLKAFAEQGLNVIGSAILTNRQWYRELKQAMEGIEWHYVAVYAPLDLLEKREQESMGISGMARGRYEEVYASWKSFDLRLDTSKATPEQSAEAVLRLIS